MARRLVRRAPTKSPRDRPTDWAKRLQSLVFVQGPQLIEGV